MSNEAQQDAALNAQPRTQSEWEADEPMLQLFRYQHLPEPLQSISRPFGELARRLVATLPPNRERATALRRLRESKDCAVTAHFFKDPPVRPDSRLMALTEQVLKLQAEIQVLQHLTTLAPVPTTDQVTP